MSLQAIKQAMRAGKLAAIRIRDLRQVERDTGLKVAIVRKRAGYDLLVVRP